MQIVAWESVVSTIVGGMLGGGAVAAVGYRALKDKLIGDLKDVFARSSELNSWGSRVNALESVVVATRERADENADAIIRLQETDKHRWQPMMNLLEKIDNRLNASEKSVIQLTSAVTTLNDRMDRHAHGKD